MPSAKAVLIVAILSIAFIIFIIAFVTSLFAQMLAIGLWIVAALTGLASIIKAVASYQEARAKHRLMDFVEAQGSHQPSKLSAGKDIAL